MSEPLLKQKSFINRYFQATSSQLSAYSFVNLYAWSDFFTFELKEVDRNLLVFAKDPAGTFLYVMPLGEQMSSRAIETAFELMTKVNGKSRLSRIENVDEQRLKYFSKDRYDIVLKSHEYCYLREDIAGLKGNAYKSQRAAFNQFTKNYQYQYLPYQKNMKNECLSLFREWKARKEQKTNDEMFRFMLEDNEKVHDRVLQAADDLELVGRVVTVDGKIKGYTFGYALNPRMFCVLFEITDIAVKGISSFIFSRFCQDQTLKPYEFINVMDDFGLPEVNQTKMSYHPFTRLASYTITRR